MARIDHRPVKQNRWLRRLWRDASGGVLVYTALIAPVLLGFGGLSVDVAAWYAGKRVVQTAADAAAIAGALEARRSGAGLTAAAQSAAADTGYDPGRGDTLTINAPPASGLAAGDAEAVEVIVSRTVPTLLSRLVFAGPVTLSARAVALVLVEKLSHEVGEIFGVSLVEPMAPIEALDKAAIADAPGGAASRNFDVVAGANYQDRMVEGFKARTHVVFEYGAVGPPNALVIAHRIGDVPRDHLICDAGPSPRRPARPFLDQVPAVWVERLRPKIDFLPRQLFRGVHRGADQHQFPNLIGALVRKFDRQPRSGVSAEEIDLAEAEGIEHVAVGGSVLVEHDRLRRRIGIAVARGVGGKRRAVPPHRFQKGGEHAARAGT